jgi:hypothetical protein
MISIPSSDIPICGLAIPSVYRQTTLQNSTISHLHHLPIRRKQLLAGLRRNTRIQRRDGRIPKRDLPLPRHLCHHPWQIVLLYILDPAPAREVPHLAVVAVVGEVELGADEEDLLVVGDDAAVVADILVADGPGSNC